MKFDWAMIASHYVVVYEGVFHHWVGLFINYKIVESPTDVFGSSSSSVAPPGILYGFWVNFSESVNPSSFKKFGKTVSFFFCESCRLLVSFWSCDIDFFVADIEISTNDGSFLFFEFIAIFLETLIPIFNSVVESI